MTKPGGHILVSVHGRANAAVLSPEEQRRFDAGEMVVVRPQHEGSNACHIYHPEAYMRNQMTGDLRFVEMVYDGINGARQDAAIFQKL